MDLKITDEALAWIKDRQNQLTIEAGSPSGG